MDRGEKVRANHWATIQHACNNGHGIQEEIMARPESGANFERRMVRMFDMFRQDNNDQDFKFLHVFTRIESREKLIECRLALSKAKHDVYNPDALRAPRWQQKSQGGEGRGTHCRTTSLIEQCIIDAKSNAAKRKEKSEARWSALMTKQDTKLDLLKTNIVAKKKNTKLAFLMGAYVSTMDGQVKA
ncbi:putative methionyl-tRNA synthetase [Hordeum vulgare]|nr:putative methionyl-tRNA synthetase [Hordeum vulgare]